MEQPIPIGVDLAKSAFQLHSVDAEGAVVLRRQLRRSQMLEFFQNLSPCLIGMEAYAGPITGPERSAGSVMMSA